jgi:secreted Zn-dependent insulinase-like peptidase
MTSDTDTTYYFSVDSVNFLEILDMFADFFIEPLLRKDQIDKEINAIESESTKNLLSEFWISVEMVKKCMFDDYPVNHYTCGTKKMLGVDNNYILMKEFFDKYYSANIMNLILFVNDKFTDVQIIDSVHGTIVNCGFNSSTVLLAGGVSYSTNATIDGVTTNYVGGCP